MTVVIMDPANPAFTVKAIVVATGAAGAGGAGGAQNFDVLPYTRANVNSCRCFNWIKSVCIWF